MHIRRLMPPDASAYQRLRLAGLQESPFAFGSSYEEEKNIPLTTIADRLAIKPDCGSFGAFEHDDLVGHIALARESAVKLSHKAYIWGMYVAPLARGKGIGRALLVEALPLARSSSGVLQVNHSVNSNKASAIRLYESVGFRAFGHEPGALFINGELHDEIHMSLRFAERKHLYVNGDARRSNGFIRNCVLLC